MPHAVRPKPQVAFACALYLAIVGFYTAAAVWYPMVYIWATYEDLIGEWIQFWSIVVAFAVSARLVLTRWRFRWFFLLLALSCLYVAMEEISWGQRLVGFSSPEFFKANNLQGEMNIHNFLTGPFGTNLKLALSYSLAAALMLYGLIYPVVLRRRFRFARWLDACGLAAPPLYLCPYFVTAAFLECSPFRFNEAEVAEILVDLGLALMTVHYQFTCRNAQKVLAMEQETANEPADVRGNLSGGLAAHLGMATALILLLSAATTTALYASPSRRARIDRRVENGVEKFAGRYARYEQWKTSVALYERVLQKEPDRVSILRKLAECTRNMGNPARSDQYTNQALAVDLEKYEVQPDRASVNRSLARTYRMMGDEERAQKHLRRALRIGLRRVERKPSSSSAAYSLGKTYLLMERQGLALEELSRALRLRPDSKRYRRAYYEAVRSRAASADWMTSLRAKPDVRS